MSNPQPPNPYTQGHSSYTVANHQRRTAESDAAFLIPYISPTSTILDVGCGPGTITCGFAKYASSSACIIGIDTSSAVLARARELSSTSGIATSGPGAVTFEQGNILTSLRFPDDSFDIVYAAQLFGHFPMPDTPLRALEEMRRVLKPGGILATRDAVAQHFFPRSSGLDRLWVENFQRVVCKGEGGGVVAEPTGPHMPALMRKAGFDVDGGKVKVGVASTAVTGVEGRQWMLWRGAGQLKKGDPFYQSWLDAGIGEAEIEEVLRAVEKWAETEDAWFMATQGEVLAWK